MASLSSPLRLGPLDLRSRNFMSSLTRNRAVPTNVPNDLMLEYYVQRTQGGAGLILSEATLISQQGTEWAHAPGLWSDEQVAGWKTITDAVHAHGGTIFAQLAHVGRLAHPDMPEHIASGKPVYSASDVAARGGKFAALPGQPGYVQPTPLEDPWSVIADYRRAAENAKRAGFDGVELHAATGFLPDQFTDATANTRTDAWGGSAENRIRFALEALKALVDVYGADRVGIKLSPGGGFNDTGMPLEDARETYGALVRAAVGLGLAYVQLVRAAPPPPQAQATSDPLRPNAGTFHDIVGTYGPLVQGSRTRLVLNGALTPDAADALIKEGKADAVAFGRPWVNNPDLQKRIAAGVPLATDLNFARLWAFDADPADGYTTYPTAT